MRKLVDRWGLREPIMELAGRGAPIFGTCAGMILLAREIVDGDEPVFPLLDVIVYGATRSGASWTASRPTSRCPCSGTSRSTASSSAPRSSSASGPDVDVLATLDDGRVVAVRQRNVLATAFHPELAGETRFHRLLTTMAGAYDEPDEGSGRRQHPDPAVGGHRRAPRRRDR